MLNEDQDSRNPKKKKMMKEIVGGDVKCKATGNKKRIEI